MIILRDNDTFCDITKADLSEHDGIMEQVTYDHSFDGGWPGSLPLAKMPWKYVERFR